MEELVEIEGDLFESKECLVHCVSADLKMGLGIAKTFKSKFGVNGLKEQLPRVGGIVVMEVGNIYIFYLVTKEKYYDKPTYKSLSSSLKAMRAYCADKQIKKVAMPRIGCGLDKLKWEKVKKIIKEVFADSISVVVYNLP